MTTSLFDEMISAARGMLGLVMGDRRAAERFDFSQRGLVGSFIVLIIAIAANAYLPGPAGTSEMGAHPWQVVLLSAVGYVLQAGFVAALLNQLGRLDGFVPYLVADNWANFFLAVITGVMILLGIQSDVLLIIVVIAFLVVEVNIGRLVVTLRPMQVVMFLVAQLIGGLVGLMMVGLILPPPPGT